MFFTECASLAERHPSIALTVSRIDALFAEMRTPGVIRPAEMASFLGIDPNQVNAVLEKLSHARLLLAAEMVECVHCGMAVLRSEYQRQMEDEGEYRCTSCDHDLSDESVKTITAYRCGEKWKAEAPVVAASEGGKQTECLIVPTQSYPKDVRLFQNQGKTWLTVYDGIPRSIADSKGMRYIAHLLQNPGQEIHAATLRAVVAGEENILLLGSAGEVLSDRTLKEYRENVRELDEDIQEAESNNDLGRATKLKEVREAVTTEIARAVGLGGRNRKAADDFEHARQAVSATIYRAKKAIKKEHEPLWQHLDNCLKIGMFLSYQPDQPTNWQT